MEELLSPGNFEAFFRLTFAAMLGLTLGAERVLAGKTAGMRTYALVSMGASLFIIISITVAEVYLHVTEFDPLRVASQIVVGVGFLGAGIIIFRKSQVYGLTTAVGVWVAASIGMAVGYGLYAIAVMATFLTLFIFTVMWVLEEHLKTVKGLTKAERVYYAEEDEEEATQQV